jgi:hypothetical protein
MRYIIDVDAFLNNIEDAAAVISTMLQGIVQRTIFQWTWDELLKMRAQAAEDGRKYSLEKKLQAEMNALFAENDWGVEVTMVALSQFVRTSFPDGVIRTISS